jgi:hypothetical protein
MGILMVFMFRTKERETEGNNEFMESFTLGRGTSTSSMVVILNVWSSAARCHRY